MCFFSVFEGKKTRKRELSTVVIAVAEW